MKANTQTRELPSRIQLGNKQKSNRKPSWPKLCEGRLLLKTKEVCELLGGIHPRTLARLEKSGSISSTKLLRHKLYDAKSLEAFVESLCEWGQEQLSHSHIKQHNNFKRSQLGKQNNQ